MNSPKLSLSEKITSNHAGMVIWQQERVLFEVSAQICELMERENVTKAMLADRIGKSRSYVTQMLSGDKNLTLRTISDVYLALGRQFHPEHADIIVDNVTRPNVISMEFYCDQDEVGDDAFNETVMIEMRQA